MAESDTALCEVVGGEFEGNFIAGQNPDTIAAEPACQVREYQAFVLKLHTEFTAGEFLDDRALHFYAVFFTHSYLLTIFFPVIVAEPVPSVWLTQNRLRTGN